MKQHIHRLCILGLLVFTHHASAQVSFSPPATYNVVPKNVIAFTVADINGDGKIDLISETTGDSPYTNGTVSIFTNNGIGGFIPATTMNPGSSPGTITAADLNGDGKMDLITANFNNGDGNTLSVLTNSGSGTMGVKAILNAGTAPVTVVTADINGDGKLALICANFSIFPSAGFTNFTLSVFTNNGIGDFGSNATINVPDNCRTVVAVDVNGDNKLDLICGGATNSLTVLTNNGHGGFVFNARPTAGANTYIGGPPKIYRLMVGDVNRDHKPDLLYLSISDSTLTILTNNGTGSFGSNATLNVGGFPGSATVADINGDGLPDLVCAYDSPPSLNIWTNNGSGGFALATTLGAAKLPRNVTVVDVNGDGRPDIVEQDLGNSTISVYTNKTIFPPPVSAPAPALKRSGKVTSVSWPSASAGWSLQQSRDLTPSHWGPGGFNGFDIADDGTNKNLTITSQLDEFFRLVHP